MVTNVVGIEGNGWNQCTAQASGCQLRSLLPIARDLMGRIGNFFGGQWAGAQIDRMILRRTQTRADL